MKISLCMIVKNEEEVLARCLESVKDFFDEIIIVDTGSSDETVEIAEQYTDKVFYFTWIDDFAAARNYSFEQATGDYVMWLDADDIILPNDLKQLRSLRKSGFDNADVIMMKYNVGFDEYGNPVMSFFRERIVKRSRGFKWVGAIHETIAYSGNAIHREIAVTHSKLHRQDPQRNLRIFKKMLKNGAVLSARDEFYYSRELYYAGDYKKAITRFNAFLSRPDGWLEDKISACIDLAHCHAEAGNGDAVLLALISSFKYDRPRAEVCCEIGMHFMRKNDLHTATFWYETAANTPLDMGRNGFCNPDCYGFIPYLQLCVCYDRLGNAAAAEAYNEKAGEIKPNHKSVIFNREYFSKK